MKISIAIPLAAALTAFLPGRAPAQLEPSLPRIPDVVFVPTPQPVVDAMLELAKIRPDEVVYDLGCGDGRAVITAAREYRARGVGVDIDAQRIAESRDNAVSAGVADRVQFREADLFEMDFSDADVVFLYLLQRLNLRLRPRLLDELRPGTRVVSHVFSMDEWSPDETVQTNGSTIYFWVVPAKVAGDWKVTLPGGRQGTLSLAQKFQKASGTMTTNGQSWPLMDVRLEGATLTFRFGEGAGAHQATARISGSRLAGTIQRDDRPQPEPWSGGLSQ